MAEIINLFDKNNFKRKQKKSSRLNDFNEILREVISIGKEHRLSLKNGIYTLNGESFEQAILGEINNYLIKKRMINHALTLCSSYVSKLVVKTSTEDPESWYAVDYLIKQNEILNNPNSTIFETKGSVSMLKQGGDMCFIVCTLLPAQKNHKSMGLEYYRKVGKIFYNNYYYQTSREIGYFMSNNFETISEITRKCLT